MFKRRLSNVLYQKDSRHKILATSPFETDDTRLTQEKGKFRLQAKDGTTILSGQRDPANGMYWMTARIVRPTVTEVANLGTAPMIRERIHENKLLLWHRRLGHASLAVIVKCHKLHLGKGIDLNRVNFASLCTTCMVAKQQDQKYFLENQKSFMDWESTFTWTSS
jgi:hypothetical protein